MCDEEFRIRRVDDQDAHRVVGRELLREPADLSDEGHVEKVDRRIVDRRPADAAVNGDIEEPIVVVGHGLTVCDPDHILSIFPLDRSGLLLVMTRKVNEMSEWSWILIAVLVVVVLGIAAWLLSRQRRSSRLKEHFGPEYDRTVGELGEERAAEAELAAREKKRKSSTSST